MCVSIAAFTWLAGRLLTQDGNWLCHTRLWPRIRAPIDLACAMIWSPGPKLNVPLDGSVVSHFISLPGVTMSNWASATESSVGLLRLGTVSAKPKYLPLASASVRRGLAADAGAGAMTATAAATTMPASTGITARRNGPRPGRLGSDMIIPPSTALCWEYSTDGARRAVQRERRWCTGIAGLVGLEAETDCGAGCDRGVVAQVRRRHRATGRRDGGVTGRPAR